MILFRKSWDDGVHSDVKFCVFVEAIGSDDQTIRHLKSIICESFFIKQSQSFYDLRSFKEELELETL